MSASFCCCSRPKMLSCGLKQLRPSSWISFAYVKHKLGFIGAFHLVTVYGAGVVMYGSRCRFAYGPADATATHYILLQ